MLSKTPRHSLMAASQGMQRRGQVRAIAIAIATVAVGARQRGRTSIPKADEEVGHDLLDEKVSGLPFEMGVELEHQVG